MNLGPLPTGDLHFALEHSAGFPEIAALQGAIDRDAVGDILDSAARFASRRLAPLRVAGDKAGARLTLSGIVTPAGMPDSYREFAASGWNATGADPAYGGQGLPDSVGAALTEIWNEAHLAFALCPLLTESVVASLQGCASPAQKARYLPALIAGRWTGTMNLTEAQAGTDLGAIRCLAEPEGEFYRLRGDKIFISYGDHDLAENIVHMVLARISGAPAGTKGLSLFIVPKYRVLPDGGLGAANDLRAIGLEAKLGLHASPTCLMRYGENSGAIGEIVGAPGRGLDDMFVMMNRARLGVGLQSLGIAHAAYRLAAAYSASRVQGRVLGAPDEANWPIRHHPDVARQLLTMRALLEAMRALLFFAAGTADRARLLPDAEARLRQQQRLDLLTPIAKAWASENAQRLASLNIQVHGGAGYIEATGAAQLYREARVLAIYEGTNGVQAMDLVGRKILRDDGAAMTALLAEMRRDLRRIDETRGLDPAWVRALAMALDRLAAATDRLRRYGGNKKSALAVATPYLTLCGLVIGGARLLDQARAAAERLSTGNGDPGFLKAKIATAGFYAMNILPEAEGPAAIVASGAASLLDFPIEAL